MRWTVRRLHLLGPPALAVAVLGWVVFFLPFRLTDLLTRLARPDEESVSTYKAMIGSVVYLLWIMAVAATAALLVNWRLGPLLVVVLPTVGVLGLRVRERWSLAWQDIRRFFLERSRGELIAALRREQRVLATQLEALYVAWQEGEVLPASRLSQRP